MSDDWRLRVDLAQEAAARELAQRLAAFASDHDLKAAWGDRVVVSHDRNEVFCYADTQQQAQAAERAVRSLAGEHGWQLTTELRHWHPVAEEWEDPEQPLVSTDSGRGGVEHSELIQREREDSEAQGFPDFEVRVRCPSRQDAERLSDQLQDEGIPNVHRWQFVVIGAEDEDASNALAERNRREAPSGSEVTAEASVQEITSEAPEVATPFNNPFAVFGGLGG